MRSQVLGLPKPRRLDQSITVSLEDLVPQNHFYRHLEATLDLGFVRDWTRGLYAERGRPSIDPIVFFKLQLIMLFERIRSERQLIATGQNLKRSLAASGWGRRHAPCGSLMTLPMEPPGLSTLYE